MDTIFINPLSNPNLNYSRVVNMFLNHSILNRSDEYIQNNMVELHVYLNQHNIEYILEQPAYELSELASDLGGV
jgi:hypothetical protein